jgi:hypothetical protein
MNHDTIAVLDAVDTRLTIFQIAPNLDDGEIEDVLFGMGYSLQNCQWQIITSMRLDVEHHL